MAKKKPDICIKAIEALGGGGEWDADKVTYTLPRPVRIRIATCENGTQLRAVFMIRYVTGTSMFGRRVGSGSMFEVQLKKTTFTVER